MTFEVIFVKSENKWIIFDKENNIVGVMDEEGKVLWNLEFAVKIFFKKE